MKREYYFLLHKFGLLWYTLIEKYCLCIVHVFKLSMAEPSASIGSHWVEDICNFLKNLVL